MDAHTTAQIVARIKAQMLAAWEDGEDDPIISNAFEDVADYYGASLGEIHDAWYLTGASWSAPS
jgi:hypothetical protein